jgi:hypothetical protein
MIESTLLLRQSGFDKFEPDLLYAASSIVCRNSIRIEVIVHMNGIDIIALNNITNNVHNKFLRLFVGRIKIFCFSISQKPFG